MMKRFFKSKFMKVIAIVFLAIVITLFLINKDIISIGGSNSSVGLTHRQLVGDSLNCTIVIDRNLNTAKPGLRFATNLIRKFGENNHCTVKISIDRKGLERWDDLIVGKSDILIVSTKDSIPEPYSDYVEQSVPVEGDYVCVVKLGNSAVLSSINYWISRYKQSSEYNKLWNNTKKLIQFN